MKSDHLPSSEKIAASAQGWASDMHDFLFKSEVTYRFVRGDEDKRAYSTATIGGILQRLEKVPTLQGVGSLHVLKDMFDFLDDLSGGRDHKWRSLGPFGGQQQYTRKEEALRTRILIAIEIMIDALGSRRGSKKEAFARVHAALPKGCGMSPARVKGLFYEYKRGDFPHPALVEMTVAGFWHHNDADSRYAKCDHGDPVHQCKASGGSRCPSIERTAQAYLPELLQDIP